MGYGFSGYIGVRRESNWGSAQAANVFVEALSENITESIERFDFKNIVATMAEPDDQAGIHRVGGDISFAGNPEALGPFLQSTFNISSITEVASGFLYEHVFHQPTTSNSAFSDDSPSVPYTFEIFRDVGTAVHYAGCLVSAFTMNFAPNQDVRCSASVVGRSSAAAAKQTPTFPGSPNKPFTFDTASVQLAGSATTRIENLTISIQNQYEAIPALDMSLYASKMRRTGSQMINVSGTMDFSDHAEYDDFINQTERQLIVSVTKASSFSMVIDIPSLVYTAFPLGMPGKERLMVDFEGKGFYHSGSGTGIEVKLVTQNSYF